MSGVTNEWFVFNKVLDKKTCNKIKKLAQGNWVESSVDTQKDILDEERTTGRKGDYKPDPRLRISDVHWTIEQWVYDIIWPFMQEANEQAGWCFDISTAESMQITRYGKGGFYSFHRDGMGDHLSAYKLPDNLFLHGRVRKLSMTVLLNEDYEGGAFEFATYKQEECHITPIEASAGSIIVFPSSIEHRVAPVTKGTRYSVVCWFLGPPFV